LCIPFDWALPFDWISQRKRCAAIERDRIPAHGVIDGAIKVFLSSRQRQDGKIRLRSKAL
jgi:hypothetical protein